MTWSFGELAFSKLAFRELIFHKACVFSWNHSHFPGLQNLRQWLRAPPCQSWAVAKLAGDSAPLLHIALEGSCIVPEPDGDLSRAPCGHANSVGLRHQPLEVGTEINPRGRQGCTYAEPPPEDRCGIGKEENEKRVPDPPWWPSDHPVVVLQFQRSICSTANPLLNHNPSLSSYLDFHKAQTLISSSSPSTFSELKLGFKVMCCT